MMYGVKRMVRYVLGTDIAGRNLAIYPDDLFLVSYPRSGNTWTRFLIANLLHPEEAASFNNIERLVPDSEAQSNRYLKSIARPRTIKSHQYFDPRYRKVIYIVRDPRDVVLSYYDFSRKYRHIDDQYSLEKYVSDFVEGRLISFDYGTWQENAGSWLAARAGRPGFLLLRYEDMLADTGRELARIAKFLAVDLSADHRARVIERSSAATMRSLEKSQANDWVSTREKRSDIPFIRTAAAGGWREKLPTACAREIESAWAPLMTQLGYAVSEGAPSSLIRPSEDHFAAQLAHTRERT